MASSEKQNLMARNIWPLVLTRARVAVSATFAMVVVGGGKVTPRLTRKLGKLEGRAIRRSKALIQNRSDEEWT